VAKNVRIKIQRTYKCAHCLCGYETWSVILREEDMLRVLENGALRRVFGTKWETVRGYRIKLDIEELYDLYCSPYGIRLIK
jgi:hypothetical protein